MTCGHYLNNSSAKLHDVASSRIAWFEHRIKQGAGANWSGTFAGAEGDMLVKILADVRDSNFKLSRIIMDYNTSAANIVTGQKPRSHIVEIILPKLTITIWEK